MEIGCDGVIMRLKTNIGNGYIRSYDARMMLHQGNMLRFTDAHVSSGQYASVYGFTCVCLRCECHLALEMDAMPLVGMTNINVYTSSAHEYVPGDSQPLEPSIW